MTTVFYCKTCTVSGYQHCVHEASLPSKNIQRGHPVAYWRSGLIAELDGIGRHKWGDEDLIDEDPPPEQGPTPTQFAEFITRVTYCETHPHRAEFTDLIGEAEAMGFSRDDRRQLFAAIEALINYYPPR